MEAHEVHRLMESFPFGESNIPELIETHISWVLVYERYVLKIKKPIHYSFLDFSTLEQRKHYCEREVALNKRLTRGIYLGVLPIISDEDAIVVKEATGRNNEEIIDYAVWMRKVDPAARMDLMLKNREVTTKHIIQIADQLIGFHKRSERISTPPSNSLKARFNDLLSVAQENFPEMLPMAEEAAGISDQFIHEHFDFLQRRGELGFVRDVHGDLHSRNIFLLDEPVIFDCIEFNDELRQIDLLDELAFFTMDLEANGSPELADIFIEYYNTKYPIIWSSEEEQLFTYYKAYRANVRAKVNMLRALSSMDNEQEKHLLEATKYMELALSYLHRIDQVTT